MNFQEFRASPSFKVPEPMAVTSTCPSNLGELIKCEILLWEPSNQHWYRPKPISMREQVGDLNTVDNNRTVIDIRPV